ncbi:hypothetical protein SAY86_026615 [Trapa natans]|uniref:Uncharacterized protein n=1 Tax=Trapa natans TaxID=22666 RepID=A0AAN7KEA4_TRANT|nr:hypothetical protein SAY86_026615 [Trapa natans]
MMGLFQVEEAEELPGQKLQMVPPPQIQDEGWPLGLQLVNPTRGDLVIPERNRGLLSGRSVSLHTLITASSPSHSANSDPSSSSYSSWDLDTKSTGSFFHERITTLGMLIGAPSTLELAQGSPSISRSLRRAQKFNKASSSRDKQSKAKANVSWSSLSALCRDSRDVEVVKNYRRRRATGGKSSGGTGAGAPSQSHFVSEERRISSDGQWSNRVGRRRLSPREFFGPYDGLGLTGLTPDWNTLFVDGRIAPPSSISKSSGNHYEGSKSSVIFSRICGKQY